MNERRVEIVAFERERIIRRTAQMCCPVCHRNSEFLTARQASVLAQVTPKSIYRWLAVKSAHAIKTAGGGLRVCRLSLFRPVDSEVNTAPLLPHRIEDKNDPMPSAYLIS